MKNKITKLFIVLMLSGFAANAQTGDENQQWLKEFEKSQRERFDRNYELAVKIANERGLPLEGVDEAGNFFQLVGVIEGTDNLKYYKTSKVSSKENVLFNNTGTKSSIQTGRVQYLHDGSSTGEVIIEGQTMIVGEWDGGEIYAGHQSLGAGRVTMKDGSTGQVTPSGTAHASHVAGTMIGNNTISDLKGMAPQASLWANNWLQDMSEMTNQSGQGLLTSNHSYGIGYAQANLHNNPSDLGRYNIDSRTLDQLLFVQEYYLPVYAAGNDRSGELTSSGRVYFNVAKGGLDLLYGEGNSKNNVVVAAIEGITAYQQASDAVMTDFSNWGPTDDYRIKPDISAKGYGVKSVGLLANDDSDTMNGTSMAAPAVTGVFTLWQQYFKQLYPTKGKMRAATVKALMAISADEAGRYFDKASNNWVTSVDGPDARFGWGVINAQRGAEILRDSKPSTALKASVVSELELANGQVYEITVTAEGDEPLKAAIAWTDRAGSVGAGSDSATPVLVNDLDLRIIRPNGQEILPWGLDLSNGGGNSIKKDNIVDPIEVVEYKGPVSGVAPAGDYKIRVSHKGTLTGGSQKFSLIVYGYGGSVSTKKNEFDNLVVYPNPTNNLLNISADLASIGNAKVQLYDIAGKQVYNNESLFYNTNLATIDISNLQAGVYMLKIENKELSQTVKVVKK